MIIWWYLQHYCHSSKILLYYNTGNKCIEMYYTYCSTDQRRKLRSIAYIRSEFVVKPVPTNPTEYATRIGEWRHDRRNAASEACGRFAVQRASDTKVFRCFHGPTLTGRRKHAKSKGRRCTPFCLFQAEFPELKRTCTLECIFVRFSVTLF